MKPKLKVTAKGQVTLRREVLDHLGVIAGGQVTVDLLPNSRVQMRAARPTGSIEDCFGCLSNNGNSPTIEEMNEVIADGWSANTAWGDAQLPHHVAASILG